jgi:hypothetical protein
MSINSTSSANIGEPQKFIEPTKPWEPPPPPDVEAKQNELNSLKSQLQANPNDAEAKNKLAHLQREVENEKLFEDQKGDKADPVLQHKLDTLLNDVNQTMSQYGVQELGKGGSWKAGGG